MVGLFQRGDGICERRIEFAECKFHPAQVLPLHSNHLRSALAGGANPVPHLPAIDHLDPGEDLSYPLSVQTYFSIPASSSVTMLHLSLSEQRNVVLVSHPVDHRLERLGPLRDS